jgi:hypothetical protein
MTQALYAHMNNKRKKMVNKKIKQVLPGGVRPSGMGEKWGKGVGWGNIAQILCTHI